MRFGVCGQSQMTTLFNQVALWHLDGQTHEGLYTSQSITLRHQRDGIRKVIGKFHQNYGYW